MQLRNMNDEAEAGLHLDNTGRHTEAFQVQYAQIVLELKQVSTPFHQVPLYVIDLPECVIAFTIVAGTVRAFRSGMLRSLSRSSTYSIQQYARFLHHEFSQVTMLHPQCFPFLSRLVIVQRGPMEVRCYGN